MRVCWINGYHSGCILISLGQFLYWYVEVMIVNYICLFHLMMARYYSGHHGNNNYTWHASIVEC